MWQSGLALYTWLSSSTFYHVRCLAIRPWIALEQALYSRRHTENLIHHSDRDVPYVSIRYTEGLAEAGSEPSAGSVGDSFDYALAESVIKLYKT